MRIGLFDIAQDELLPFVMAGNAEFGIGSIEDGSTEVRIKTLIEGSLSAIAIKDAWS